MPSPPKPERVIEVLQWYEDNGKNCTVTGKQFGLSRKTIGQWNKDYDLQQLTLDYKITRTVGTNSTVVEKIIPPDVKDEAEKALKNITTITSNAAILLKLWVDDCMERALSSDDGIKVLKPYEIDRLQRLTKDYAAHILPEKILTDTTVTSVYDELKKKLEDSNLRKQ